MRSSIAHALAGSGRGIALGRDARVPRGVLVAWLLVGVPAGQPGIAAAQEPPAAVAEAVTIDQEQPGPGALPGICAARSDDGDTFLAEVALARELESPEAAKAALDALEPDARLMAAQSPDDVTAQYHLAAVMGARLDHEQGRSKMSGAEALRAQVLRVLELDPEHAGASYMLGKLHASVLRLGGFKRFLARQLFGGGALKGASWEEAQALLEVAVREDPCVPDHHFELARVYAERGDSAGAERELAYVSELTAGRDGRQARLRERAEELVRK